MAIESKLSINLWFESQAEEAANFYCNVFKNSYLGRSTRYGKEGFEFHKQPEGSVMTIEFNIEGIQFVGLNGGTFAKFNEAISLVIGCESQEEIDYYWEKLGQDGDPAAQQCGWLKDKYGVSWQVVPKSLSEMVADPDKKKVQRVMNAFLPMKKLDLKTIEEAYKGSE